MGTGPVPEDVYQRQTATLNHGVFEAFVSARSEKRRLRQSRGACSGGFITRPALSSCLLSGYNVDYPIVLRRDAEETPPTPDEPRFLRRLLEQHTTPFWPWPRDPRRVA